MKKLLPIVLLAVSVSVSAQNKLFEKISISRSYLTEFNDGHQEGNYNSTFNAGLGFVLMKPDKNLTLRKELEVEMFFIKGWESLGEGALGGGTYARNIRSYSVVAAFKLLPMLKLDKQASFFAGPVFGSNLKAHVAYDLNWWIRQSAPHGIYEGYKYISESANKNFSRLFFGLEGGFSFSLEQKGGDCWFEISSYYYFDYAWNLDKTFQFDRYGIKVSLVNPTGLIFRDKKLSTE